MANTGYIINPNVTQVFTSGPNSGSQVSSSFTYDLNPTTSSLNICDFNYTYKIYNPELCPPDIYCVPPQIINIIASTTQPGAYKYNIITNVTDIPEYVVEISYNSSFTGTTASLSRFPTSSLPNEIFSEILDLSTLLPIYPNCAISPMYFRFKNICTGSISSDWVYSGGITCDKPIIANDDYYTINQGDTLLIHPIFNDVLYNNPTIISITQPSHGSSVIINGTTIRYIHNNSTNYTDSFTYTIGNGFSTSSANINFNIIPTNQFYSISTSTYGTSTSQKHIACAITGPFTTRYYNGNGSIEVGDYIYTSPSLSNPFSGGNKLYKTPGNRVIQIANTGQVLSIQSC